MLEFKKYINVFTEEDLFDAKEKLVSAENTYLKSKKDLEEKEKDYLKQKRIFENVSNNVKK